MKIPHALLRLVILTHALASTAPLAKVPLADGSVAIKSTERGVKSGDSDIESRASGTEIPSVVEVKAIIAVVYDYVISQVDIHDQGSYDDSFRAEFTKTLVSKLYDNNSNANYVITTNKTPAWSPVGANITDWNSMPFQLVLGYDLVVVDYNILWFRSGTFRLQGKGGYKNWAWEGMVVSNSDGVITFDIPS